jgi:PA domain
MNRLAIFATTAFAILGVCDAQAAARIIIQNNDAAGTGFNDTTAATPIGGNAGVTLGEQRLITFQAAADVWGRNINSSVPITIRAQFAAQTCSATGATLGSAGTISIFTDFPNAPLANHWYSGALANALAGADQDPANPEINATFNISIDAQCLGAGTGWYYGIDPSLPIPAGKTALMPVLLHEFGHGLGFQSFASRTTGAYPSGRIDIWSEFQKDQSTLKFWKDMTDAERLTSQVNDPNLVWTGARTKAMSDVFLVRPIELLINSPAGIAGNSSAQSASYGPLPTTAGATSNVVLADPVDACMALNNGAATAGKVVLIARGTCSFKSKTLAAQNASAIAVIIYNNAATGQPPLGDDTAITTTITIPTIGITQALGQSITANLTPGPVNLTVFQNPAGALSGTNGGFVRLHAPNPVVAGSSVSHFSVDTLPNTLMEPAINFNLFNRVDLTKPLFEDIGWSTTLFSHGFETID